MDREGISPGEIQDYLFYKHLPDKRAIQRRNEVELKMSPNCPECGTRLVLVEENTLACPTCGQVNAETPRACDYCHEHVASMPSENGKWICDYCIMGTIVGPDAFKQVLAVQARLAGETGKEISLHDAFTAWRQSTESVKINSTSPVPEVNAHAS